MDPERWLVVTVRVEDEADGDEAVAVLLAVGGAAVEEDGDLLTTYLMPPEDPDARVLEAVALLREALGYEPEVVWRWQVAEDWAAKWRRGLGPRRVGERLIVTPSWAEPEAEPGRIVIAIDPKMAFGTGEHASTRGVLRLLERAVEAGDDVLDVGAGSALLSIAAALLGAERVLAVESDGEALPDARENVERNGVATRVELVQGLVDADYLAGLRPRRFDVIAANVLSGVLRPLLPAFRNALRPGGRLLLGGIMETEAAEAVADAAAAGLPLQDADVEDGWWSGRFEGLGDP